MMISWAQIVLSQQSALKVFRDGEQGCEKNELCRSRFLVKQLVVN